MVDFRLRTTRYGETSPKRWLGGAQERTLWVRRSRTHFRLVSTALFRTLHAARHTRHTEAKSAKTRFVPIFHRSSQHAAHLSHSSSALEFSGTARQRPALDRFRTVLTSPSGAVVRDPSSNCVLPRQTDRASMVLVRNSGPDRGASPRADDQGLHCHAAFISERPERTENGEPFSLLLSLFSCPLSLKT